MDLGLERGRARGGSVRELREVGELMRKRVSDLNVVGPTS